MHVYINSNVVVDRGENCTKYTKIEQHDTKKSSIGIYVADVSSKNEGEHCYVNGTSVYVNSETKSECGYYHANNGAASGNSVGGVVEAILDVKAYSVSVLGIWVDDVTINSASGLFYDAYYDAQTGNLRLRSADIPVLSYQNVVMSANGKAGAGLLDYVELSAIPVVTSNLGLVLKSMRRLSTDGHRHYADQLAAAVAGSSITALGTAQMQDMKRQLNNLKMRTHDNMQLKGKLGEQGLEYSAWISADSGYNSLNQDGTAAGYSLSTVGGSLGADIRVTDDLSLGAAYSAGYGDLNSKSVDAGKGDFDTRYITLYAGYNQSDGRTALSPALA